MIKEYLGFIKFLARAADRIPTWSGKANKEYRIIHLAAIEWDCMSEHERSHFIKSQRQWFERQVNKKYLSHRFIQNLKHNYINNPDILQLCQSAKSQFNIEAKAWKRMSEIDKYKFTDTRIPCIGMNHVIELRDILHRMYKPEKLALLEMIIKTKPKPPLRDISLYKITNSFDNKEGLESWNKLTEQEKMTYRFHANLDLKRYKYQKNQWLTNFLQIDLLNFDVSFAELISKNLHYDSVFMNTLLDFTSSSDNVIIKRPPTVFALFIQSMKNKDSEAKLLKVNNIVRWKETWCKMSEDEKRVYYDLHKKMMCEYVNEKHSSKQSSLIDNRSSAPIFTHNKNKAYSRPCHLVRKVPKLLDIFAKDRKVSRAERREKWNNLSDLDKKQFYDKWVTTSIEIKMEKKEQNDKIKIIKQLCKEARDLEYVKTSLGLVDYNRDPDLVES